MSFSESLIYNVIIIGSGVAGSCAGLYAARANLEPLMFEGTYEDGYMPGGQLTTTSLVENYLGLDGETGYDLSMKFLDHAKTYGLKTLERSIVAIDTSVQPISLRDSEGQTSLTRSVIIATGATAKRLHLPGEDTYWHHGISSCAVCDGALPMFRNQAIIVVGGGDTAMEEALWLSKFAKSVTIVHRRDTLRASKIMINRVQKNPKISILYDHEIARYGGEHKLQFVVVKNVKTGLETQMDVGGLFFGLGHTPNTDFLKGASIELDREGYVIQREGTMTNVAGVFSAGDVSDRKYRQAITAAGSGCMAALDVGNWLQESS